METYPVTYPVTFTPVLTRRGGRKEGRMDLIVFELGPWDCVTVLTNQLTHHGYSAVLSLTDFMVFLFVRGSPNSNLVQPNRL